MVVWLVCALAAAALLVAVLMMMADRAGATNVSQTGDEGGGGTTAAATTGAAAATAPELQPLQPKSSGAGAGAGKSAKSTRSKSNSLMASLMGAPAPLPVAPPLVDEAKQQALEDAQRAKLPEKLRFQCGYPSDNFDGFGPWSIYDDPPRIKESKVPSMIMGAAIKAKLLGHVNKIFEYNTVQGMRIPFEPADVIQVLDLVEDYLKSEPMLIEDLPFGITVVGDLHAQLYELARIFKHDEKDGKPGWECMKYLFLGDYIDRGRQGLEILMALFSLKILYPDRIFLLRGNHEFLKTNISYGFQHEMLDRYDMDTANTLYLYFNGMFANLSICAIVGDRYFCAHGGISAHAFTRANLRAKKKPYYFSHDDQIVNDIVWSDPAEGLRGTLFNGERCCAVYFGLDVLVQALNSIGCDVLVRAHSNLAAGYSITGNGMCVSLFSCTGMNDGENHGSVMFIDDDGYYKVSLLRLSKLRMKWEKALKVLDYGGVQEEGPDEKTIDNDAPGVIKNASGLMK